VRLSDLANLPDQGKLN